MRHLLPALLLLAACPALRGAEKITFPAADGLLVTADLYLAHPPTAPFILLCHQADYSRGEYRELAPQLNALGFNAMAIDQRSGETVNGVANETAARAKAQKKPQDYLAALPDIQAAAAHAKAKYAKGRFILWGSSYSASLVLKLAGDTPGICQGVLAFAPGEYFEESGQGKAFIAASAARIQAPVFITSGLREKPVWWPIWEKIPEGRKTFFLPETRGRHGSQALWASTPEHKDYWTAVKTFLAGL